MIPGSEGNAVRLRNGGWAVLCYGAATLMVAAGVAVAALRFPGGFDWAYTVVSRLASNRHNPDGGVWLSGSLLVAVLLLWPVAGHLGRVDPGPAPPRGGGRPRVSTAALRLGLIAGALLAVEGLLGLDLTRLGRKGHETLAMLAFIGLYWGVLGLCLHRMRRQASFVWPALAVILPLLAVGLSQLALYFDQRELGWVNTSWRELGVPVWLSFAFWQWLAVGFLGLGLGFLVVTGAGPGVGSQRDPGARRAAPHRPPAITSRKRAP
jgi:hypothetical protein